MRTKEMACLAAITVLLFTGGGMLMSVDTAYAEGTGTQDDPYHGIVELDSIRDIYVEVGTQITITFDVGFGFANLSTDSDDIGLECLSSGGETVDAGRVPAIFSGTIDSIGTAEILVDNGRFTNYYYIHSVPAPFEELEFLSNPEDDGVVSYA